FADIFYYDPSVQDTITKRYYAGEMQVATRVNDELIYNLYDPSGLSLVMADVDGDEIGRMLYDGFGGVLTSTVPITLTGTVSDVPDATTGLVYRGGGSWYDPALGRPLQPNAVGGPLTIPQTLNRYTATPLGQPGVYQAKMSSLYTSSDFSESLLSNSIGEVVSNKVIAPLGMRWKRTYWQEIVRNSSSSKGALRKGTQQLVDAGMLSSEARMQLISNGYWKGSSNLSIDELKKFTRTIDGAEKYTISRRIGNISVSKQLGITVGDLAPGIGADLIVGSLWQAVGDGDLWLSDPGLAARRAGHAGVVNATVGVGGALLAAKLVAIVNIPDPSDLAVVPLTIIVTSILDHSIGDYVGRVFEPLFGDIRTRRNLEALKQ
ncbi:MAG: hypothetical protein DWQ04_21515, partial [Chloroflexi bacterium]